MHADRDSRIWEAANVDCDRAQWLSKHEGAAGCHRWLSARAPGLRQLAFCDSCICVGAPTFGEVCDPSHHLKIAMPSEHVGDTAGAFIKSDDLSMSDD